jgi:hypothetical protein
MVLHRPVELARICGKFGRNPQHFRLLFAYGRRTRIDSSATDVREDLLHVL